MATATKTAGFYGTEIETFYATPAGRAWIVASPDFDGIREIDGIPDGAASLDGLIDPAEAIGYCQQVQDESGEVLIFE